MVVKMIEFDKEEYKKIAHDIFTVDSPTGFTDFGISVVERYLKELGYSYRHLNKGGIEVTLDGKDNSKVVATSSHVDTLGLMVRSITPKGTLKLVEIGGVSSPSLDGEYCKIYTRNGKVYTGTIIIDTPAVHVFPDARSKERSVENLEVRIDEEVKSKEDVLALGINHGDFVCYDPKFMITDSGFLKSRFIDDKAHVALLLQLLRYLKKNNIKPKYKTKIYFVVYEEIGHGASMIASDINEYVTLDMGCVGLDLDGNEYSVSICAKDAFSPYDYELTTRLINYAKELGIPYAVDIYPRYSSDVSAALKAGADIKGALIGTGTCASHSMERTHMKGLEATFKLIYKYLVD